MKIADASETCSRMDSTANAFEDEQPRRSAVDCSSNFLTAEQLELAQDLCKDSRPFGDRTLLYIFPEIARTFRCCFKKEWN